MYSYHRGVRPDAPGKGRRIRASAAVTTDYLNIPADEFEQESLALALQGKPNQTVERHGNRWYYRRSVALSNSFHTSCALCHTNFTPQFFEQTNNPGQWVGALTLRVPVKGD